MSKRSYEPDWRPEKRKKNLKVMADLHVKGVFCGLCDEPGTLHHVLKRSQGGDDVTANLVGLCGHGTKGHHGKIENNDRATMAMLGDYLLMERPDTLDYLHTKLGEAAPEWLRTHLFI